MIQCKNISFQYKKESVYENFNWDLKNGSIIGLLGPNGAGKTTLFKMLTGLMFPNQGEISVLGYEPKKRDRELYQRMAYVGESLALPNMSPEEYLMICGPMYPNFSKEVFYRLADDFEIDMKKLFVRQSAGDLRKAWLAIALSYRTELLLLDEPSKGLDINAQGVLRKALAKAGAEGTKIILSTHHVREVEGLLDHITLIDRGGHLRLNASVEELYREFHLTHNHSKEGLPEEALAYQRTPLGWTALVKGPSEEAEDISLELLFTGLCKSGKEVSHD